MVGPLKHLGVGVSFLAFIGSSPYLLQDISKLPDEQASILQWTILVLYVCVYAGFVFWLIQLRGEKYDNIKALWERVFAFLMLVVSAPFLLVISLLIKLESPGPAIYKQERVGYNRRRGDRRRLADRRRKRREEVAGVPRDRRKDDRRTTDLGGQPFVLYKLRSMTDDAESGIGPAWSTGERDPRVTRVGRFVRKTHIDEIPQLFNVLRGEMSVIGPRPERAEFVAQLREAIDGYQDRLNAMPGLTGLAQVRQDADESLEDVTRKLEHDREYIRKRSMVLDIKIVFETITLMVGLLFDALKPKKVQKAEPKAANTLMPENLPANQR